jgi:sulfonate transport system substrate-binding protein
MNRVRKLFKDGILNLVLCATFSLLLLDQSQAAQKVVHIGSFSEAIDYAPYVIARDKKWFEEALNPKGFDVKYVTFQSLPTINESFATNRVDVVFEAEPPAIIGRSVGIDIRVVGISCSLKQEILVPLNSPVKSIRDLAGRKVAVLAGTSSHYGLLKILRDAGVLERSIKVIDMRPPDAKSAFETGQIDAWAVWPPFVEQELATNRGRVLEGSEAQIHSIMAIRGKFMDEHSDLTSAILSVLEQAKSWIKTNPEEAKSIIAKHLSLDPKVVSLAWPKHKWDAKFTDPVIIDIQAKADFLRNVSST